MMTELLGSLFIAFGVAGIIGLIGILLIRGKKAKKSDSELMITEAKIAVLLTDINTALKYTREG